MKRNVALVHLFAMFLSGAATLQGALTHDPSYPGIIWNYVGVSAYFLFMIPFGKVWWELAKRVKNERAIVDPLQMRWPIKSGTGYP